MDRLNTFIKEYFTGHLNKIDPKDIRVWEVLHWLVLLFNLFTFFLNLFLGSLFFLVSVVGILLMMYNINNYYRNYRGTDENFCN